MFGTAAVALAAGDPVIAPILTASTADFKAEYLAIIPVAIGVAVVPLLARKGWRFLTSLIR